jgi:putative hydrolase
MHMADGDDFPPLPFGGLPFFNDMMRAMSQQGPLNWELAQQFAQLGAVGEEPDPEPHASTRIEYNTLADIADMHVRQIAGAVTTTSVVRPEILTTTRARWAHRTLNDLRPLFTDLATALSTRTTVDEPTDDPFASMLSNLSTMMAPAMMGMSIGSMVGALASHALGQYELPLARPESREILIVSSSVDGFAKDWDIAQDDMRMWVLIHELASHIVLGSPAVTEGLMVLIRQHVSAFRPDPQAVMDSVGELDLSNPEAVENIQKIFSDPMVLMGAMRTPEQENLAPLLDAHVAAISAYIDFIVDSVGTRLLGAQASIAEAVRRRRVEYGTDAVLIERLLGISSTRAQQTRGHTFIQGIIERTDSQTLARLTQNPTHLPTPNELEAPGLWLARLEIS